VNPVTAWIENRVPPDEDLSKERCAELATELGQARELWQHLVRHDPNERVYAELYRDIHLDVWLVCWDDSQDTGLHDHDLSVGAVYVADGGLVEDRLVLDGEGIARVSVPRPAGEVFDFDAARVHCMRHPGGTPAVTVHCYSPALWRMGYYSYDDDANLCRTSVTYADEMWARPSGLVDLTA
jgi:hypothetical protein